MLVFSSTRPIPTFHAAVLAVVGGVLFSSSPATASEQYRWSVQYLIDQSQSVFGRSQFTAPRGDRALAVSPDRKFLYSAYLWTPTSKGNWKNATEIRKIDISEPDYEKATVALLPSSITKALAVDEAGRVYAAMGNNVRIYDADLAHELFSIPTVTCDGVAIAHEGGQTVLYTTERDRGTVKRFEISSDSFGAISKVKQAGFENGAGEFRIPGAMSLRGVTVDSHGRIWVADLGGDSVYRIEPSGKDLKSIKLHTPMAIAFDGSKGYVSLWRNREIAVISDEMAVVGALTVPWKELEMSVLGNNHQGALAAIAVDPGKGFWVANEHGQTADQKSTYGRVDKNSLVIKGKLYTDAEADDNDPVLHAVVVLPGADGVRTSVAAPEPSDNASVPAQSPAAKEQPTGDRSKK